MDDDFLVGVVAEWREYRDQPGAMSEMAAARDVNRHTLRRWLERAEERGLFPEGRAAAGATSPVSPGRSPQVLTRGAIVAESKLLTRW